MAPLDLDITCCTFQHQRAIFIDLVHRTVYTGNGTDLIAFAGLLNFFGSLALACGRIMNNQNTRIIIPHHDQGSGAA